MNKIITIGREFGSGGRELGRRLAEELGIAYYDREIIAEIAKRTELSEQYVQQIVEHRPLNLMPITIGHSICPVPHPLMEQNQEIYRQQAQILTEMSEKSDCVLVGRCADYILAGRDNTINVFVYAPRETRVNRIMARRNLSEAEALKAITTSDKERGNHYFRYTDQKWGKAQNYDICINSALMGIEKTAEMLTAMAKIEVRA